ncbi:hypothetical protein CRI93_01455 [Longimonas halophila]|uniref:DUF1819 domain-containing protein n=1 Tax=Longimonas halophila TaxID=1469170 RepID=A0A2H3P1G9_9BACT|nr:BrxA family protein [Longimonas halophila]PEN09420.1 hypothetical protein CRI93_01455 [Longimonas halophila]
MPYRTTFAAGTLLHDEVRCVLRAAGSDGSLDDVSPEVLDINSAAGRERRFLEVKRRLQNVEQRIWADLLTLSPAEQRVVLYYVCMKTYALVRDIHMNAVLPAWRSIAQSLGAVDIQRVLDTQADNHPEIDDWSPETHDKIQQVVRRMLSDVGLLQGGQLQRIRLPYAFWARFARVGDVWFLEAMLLNKEERAAAINAARMSGNASVG